MDDSKNRKIGAILSYISIISSTLISLVYTPFMIRSLGQSEYGLYSLISSVIGYLTLLDLGFGNAIVVYTAKYRAQKKYEEEKKLHGMFFIIFCIIGLIAGIGGLILYFNVNNLFGNTMNSLELHKAKIMMLILTFNLVISFVFSIYGCILGAYEKFVYQKVISILNTILRPIIMIPLLFLGYKSITMVVVITVLNILVLLSNYIYCRNKLNIRIKYRGFDKILFKTILGYSIWIFLGVIVDKINWSVDQFVLGAVAGTVAVSVYSVASSINQLFINLSTAVSGVLLPKVSKMVANKASDKEITNEFIKVGRIQYYIIFLMASGLILFGKEFFIAWVGKEYVNAYYIALILILPVCIPLIQNLGISIMQAKNMHKFRSILYAIIAIANIIISIPLAKMYAGIGSAIGTGLSLIIGNGIIINIYYYKKVGIDVIKFWKEIIKMTIPNIIPIVLIILIMKFISLSGYINVIVFGGIYTILYCLTCYFITMNKYEKGFVNKILTKLKLKKV
ncbi:MAG: oligosaccharide flippase family protein [Candidatus Coprovivens sp.]